MPPTGGFQSEAPVRPPSPEKNPSRPLENSRSLAVVRMPASVMSVIENSHRFSPVFGSRATTAPVPSSGKRRLIGTPLMLISAAVGNAPRNDRPSTYSAGRLENVADVLIHADT